MSSEKRIPDEIFEELLGLTDKNGKLEDNISQKEFDKKYSLNVLNKLRIKNAAEAFFSLSIEKIYQLFKREKYQNNFLNFNEFKNDNNEEDDELIEESTNTDLGLGFGTIKNFLTPFISVLNSIYRLKKIFKFFSKIRRFFIKFFRIILNAFKYLYKFIVLIVKKIFFILRMLFKVCWKVRKFFIFIGKMIIKAIRGFLPFVKKSLNKIFGTLIPKFKSLFSKIKKLLRPLFKLLGRVKKILIKFGGKILAKLGARMATSAAVTASGVGAPIGMIMAIGSALWTAWDLYDIYKMIKTDREVQENLIEIVNASENINQLDQDNTTLQNEEIFTEEDISPVVATNLYRNEMGEIISIDKETFITDEDTKNIVKQTVQIIKKLALHSPEIQKILDSKKSELDIFNEYQKLVKSENKNIIGKSELLLLLGSPDGTKPINLIEIWRKIINWIKNNIFEFISAKKIVEKLNLKMATNKNEFVDDNYIFDITGKIYKSDTSKNNQDDSQTVAFIEKSKIKTTDIFEPFFNAKSNLNTVQRSKTFIIKELKAALCTA